MMRSPGWLLAAALCPSTLAAQSTYQELQAFSGVLNQIRANYVDSVATGHLVQGAIDGMLRSLDPHSRFLRRTDADRLAAWEAGDLAWTGILLDEVAGRPTVLSVYPGSDAERRGVLAGDRILAVGDSVAEGRSIDQLRAMLLAPEGKKIRVSLERGSRMAPQSYQVALKNKPVDPIAVDRPYRWNDGTGYIRLREFTAQSAEDLERAIRDLDCQRLILDLRGNPGGLLMAAVDVAGLFLPERTVVLGTKGRKRSVNRTYRTDGDGPFRRLPLVVLMDHGSASASEAVGGALQDHDRALIVGRRSFGKALIQMPFEVPPFGDVVYLTIGYVATPSGRVIQRPFRGLTVEQYRSQAGSDGPAGIDSTYRSVGGRPLEGGGGIRPDVATGGPPELPVWLTEALHSNLIATVADSVAHDLPSDISSARQWYSAAAGWPSQLAEPFMMMAESRLDLTLAPSQELAEWIARLLAARVAEVRWGRDAKTALLVETDTDVSTAKEMFPRIEEILRDGPAADGPDGPQSSQR